ncbi:MAG: ABC transporter ATP-binding protein/permease [Bdellovibrionaceae bacterium]|nr:ABC transporter ATP-binding protein/permease [Pseudobdellovibrionaceae bacterium]
MSQPSAYSEDQVKVKITLGELLLRLWPYFMRQKASFTLVILAVVGLAITGRLIPTVFGHAIDEGILKNRTDVLLGMALVYIALEVFKAFMMFTHSYLFSKVGNRVLFEIRDELITHTQSLPVPFFDKNPTGRIVTRVTNDVVALGELFTQGIIHMISNFFSMMAIVVAMYLISPKMATITLLIAPPLLYIGFRLSQRIREVLRESKKKLAAINSFVAENISGMRILQLYLRVTRNRGRFDTLSREYQTLQLRQVRLYALLWPTVNFFNAVSLGVALWYGGVLTAQNAISTGAMIAFILHVQDFIHPLKVILEKYQLFQNSLSGAERIFTLLEEAQEDASGEPLGEARLQGKIEYRDVSFRYSEHLPTVLENVNLEIRPGQSVALVGRTGSGKSTMIALLQRLYDVRHGEIRIDGRPLASIRRADLRQRIGIVQQDTFMFRGTIADNIGLGDPRITRERIAWAAEQACCSDLLKRHPDGLDAKVEERGANLSFGERQLITFARILAFDPDILILDEATANIDSQSEALIQEATRHVTRGRTSIIIAHRISTILECDLIVTMDKGRIVESGRHSELIARTGAYFQLCQSQFRDNTSTITASVGPFASAVSTGVNAN